ncbi:MAG: acylphosphatase [Bacteroidota bacterium]
MNLVRAEIKVIGKVQGVGFRWFVNQHAQNLELKGTVQNNFDSSVFVIAEGEKEKIEKLISHLKIGPKNSRVENVEINWSNVTNLFLNFKITG